MADTLEAMEKKKSATSGKDGKKFPGYPHYPENEDVFNQKNIEEDLDPEQPGAVKSANPASDAPNELDFSHDVTGTDLDVPGAELDDAQENIGSEDEENNYYSLGGDDKENLEEDNRS